MVVLKKIKAATLIETLTASVLIIVVFMIASLCFNNIFNNHVKQDRGSINNRIKELEYQIHHQKIKTPYTEEFGAWNIEILKKEKWVTISYSNQGKTLERILYSR